MTRLLSALVNGGLLAAGLTFMVWVVLRLVPRRAWNAATRYALWWATLAITVALPILYLPLPRVAAGPTRTRDPQSAVIAAQRPLTSLRDLAVAPRTTSTGETGGQETRATGRATFVIGDEFPHWLFAAWMLVSAWFVLRLAISSVLLYRIGARALNVPLAAGIRRRVRIAASHEIATPVAVGPLRPSILIPAALLYELEHAELEQIVAHEAGHLARYDDYALLAQRMIEAVFSLHPVVRWIARQIDLEREVACDDRVIAATGRARSYASCLTRVVELGGTFRPSLAAAGAADDTSHLARRVDMLLDKTRHTGTRLLKARLAIMIGLVAALAWIGGREGRFVAFAAPLMRTIRTAPLPIPLPAMTVWVTDEPQAPAANDFEGRVVEDSSGNPVASAEVRFHKAGMRELAADLDSDRDGRVRASDLPAGDYTVDVSKPNYITASMKLKIPGDAVTVRLVRYAVISGQVTDQQGKPVPGTIHAPYGRTIGGARVAVLAKTEAGEEARVVRELPLEEGGKYRVYDLPPGQYVVGLWYDGLKEGAGVQLYPDNAHPRAFTVGGGEEYPNIDFLVLPQGSNRVSGKVEVRKKGEVYSVALGLPEQPVLPIAQTLTKDDGSFEFDRVPTGAYDLFVGGPDHGYGMRMSLLGPDPVFARQKVAVSGNVENLTIALSPGRSVAVTLRGHGSDAPPPGCPQSVSVYAASLEPWALLFQNNTMVAAGKETTVKNLAPGRFRLSAGSLGGGCYQANDAIADLSGETPAPVAIELAAAGQIHGTLAGAARPSGFAVVLLESGGVFGSETRLAFPDAQGRFAFESLHPGRYRIAAEPAAEPKARWVADVARMTELEVTGGSATEVELPVATKGGRQ
jgi:beta-lactamase regulating signal transducer with metallopeptidase domain